MALASYNVYTLLSAAGATFGPNFVPANVTNIAYTGNSRLDGGPGACNGTVVVTDPVAGDFDYDAPQAENGLICELEFTFTGLVPGTGSPQSINGFLFSVSDAFTDTGHGVGSHFHSNTTTTAPAYAAGFAEVGGFFGSGPKDGEESRGLIEFDISGVTNRVATAELKIRVADLGFSGYGISPEPSGIDGLFGQGRSTETIAVELYIANGNEELSDYNASIGAVLGIINAATVNANDVLTFEAGGAINTLREAGASYLGIRLRQATGGTPSGAITFDQGILDITPSAGCVCTETVFIPFTIAGCTPAPVCGFCQPLPDQCDVYQLEFQVSGQQNGPVTNGCVDWAINNEWNLSQPLVTASNACNYTRAVNIPGACGEVRTTFDWSANGPQLFTEVTDFNGAVLASGLYGLDCQSPFECDLRHDMVLLSSTGEENDWVDWSGALTANINVGSPLFGICNPPDLTGTIAKLNGFSTLEQSFMSNYFASFGSAFDSSRNVVQWGNSLGVDKLRFFPGNNAAGAWAPTSGGLNVRVASGMPNSRSLVSPYQEHGDMCNGFYTWADNKYVVSYTVDVVDNGTNWEKVSGGMSWGLVLEFWEGNHGSTFSILILPQTQKWLFNQKNENAVSLPRTEFGSVTPGSPANGSASVPFAGAGSYTFDIEYVPSTSPGIGASDLWLDGHKIVEYRGPSATLASPPCGGGGPSLNVGMYTSHMLPGQGAETNFSLGMSRGVLTPPPVGCTGPTCALTCPATTNNAAQITLDINASTANAGSSVQGGEYELSVNNTVFESGTWTGASTTLDPSLLLRELVGTTVTLRARAQDNCEANNFGSWASCSFDVVHTGIFVDPDSGNQANPGTIAAPKQDIRAVVNDVTLPDGSIVFLKRGTETIIPVGGFDLLRLRDKTSVTLDAYGYGSCPIINGLDLAPGASTAGPTGKGLVEMVNCIACGVRNWEVKRTNAAGFAMRDEADGLASSGCFIEFCRTFDTRSWGIHATGVAETGVGNGLIRNVTMQYNLVDNACTAISEPALGGAAQGEGMAVGGFDGAVIRGNEIRNYHKEGLVPKDGTNFVVEGNYIHDRNPSTLYGLGQGAALSCDGSLNGLSNGTVEGNIIKGDPGGGLIATAEIGGTLDNISYQNNIVMGNSVSEFGIAGTGGGGSGIKQNIRVYGNTFIQNNLNSAQHMVQITEDEPAKLINIQFRGNIFARVNTTYTSATFLNDISGGFSHIVDSNQYWNNGQPVAGVTGTNAQFGYPFFSSDFFDSFPSRPTHPQSCVGQPTFFLDVRPASPSVGIDNWPGNLLGDDFYGTSPHNDIGAIEI